MNSQLITQSMRQSVLWIRLQTLQIQTTRRARRRKRKVSNTMMVQVKIWEGREQEGSWQISGGSPYSQFMIMNEFYIYAYNYRRQLFYKGFQIVMMKKDHHVIEIMNFLKSYQINHIDSQTLVLSPISHQDISNSIYTNDTQHNQQSAYLIKHLNLPKDAGDLASIVQTLAHHQTLNQKYLLTLLSYEVVQTYDGTMIQAIYQYSSRSLKQQIQNRVQNNAVFDEEELWAILSTIVKGLSHLQQNGIVYGVLGTDKIFINQTVKLLDPSATATDPLLITEGRLYSPQILNNLPEIDMFKSDVYVAGLILLECGLLIDLSKEVEPDLSHYFSIFREAYSEELYYTIEQMLTINPNERVALADIKEYLNGGLEQTKITMNKNCELRPCEHDEEAAVNSVDEIQQFEEYQNCDTLCEGDNEKFISEYEKARMNYLTFVEDRSPISTTKSSKVKSVHRYSTNSMNQENESYQNTQRKKTKEIKQKLIKNMKKSEVEQVHEESYESQDSENHLFTDPALMKIIQNDLQKITTTRNSTYINRDPQWPCP